MTLVKESLKGSLYCDTSEGMIERFTVLWPYWRNTYRQQLHGLNKMVFVIYFHKSKYLVKELLNGSLYCDPSERIIKWFAVL